MDVLSRTLLLTLQQKIKREREVVMASDQNRAYAIKVNVLEYRDRETQNMQKVLVRPRKEQTAQGRSLEDQSNMLRTGALINDFKTRSFF
jgi:hypothetical protein